MFIGIFISDRTVRHFTFSEYNSINGLTTRNLVVCYSLSGHRDDELVSLLFIEPESRVFGDIVFIGRV